MEVLIMKRYQVVTYSDDIGTDEQMDFNKLYPAILAAGSYKKREDYAAVYDRVENIAFVVFGSVLSPVFSESVRVITID
jgi:hypothetical protein